MEILKRERSPLQVASLLKARERAKEIRAKAANSKTLNVDLDIVAEVLKPSPPPVAPISDDEDEEVVVKAPKKKAKAKKRIVLLEPDSDDTDSDAESVQVIKMPRRKKKESAAVPMQPEAVAVVAGPTPQQIRQYQEEDERVALLRRLRMPAW